MLVQDTLTGYFHEVPDGQLYETGYGEYPDQIGEGQVVYDGLGNPVGFLPFIPAIASLAARALPAVASALPGVTNLVRGLLPGGAPAQAAPQAAYAPVGPGGLWPRPS